jgi:hypothetical protein
LCQAGTFTAQSNGQIVKSGLTMASHGMLAAYAAYAIGQYMESMYVDIAAQAQGAEL